MKRLLSLILVGAFLALPVFALADEAAPITPDDVQNNLNFVWTLVAAFLVFLMQAGFAMVEAGFTRAKNACNIMMKNMMDFSVGALAFWAIGFGLMFGTTNGFFGTSDFFFSGASGDGEAWNYAFWMFQVVFAATAATIISGAVAERTKFSAYLVYSFFVSALIYPVFGSWAWGSLFHGAGWLEGMGFIDFAGSTVVHSVGGWLALAGAIVVGPRLGKYTKEGKVKPIPGHNIPVASLGVFLLWFGWYGFNPGSTTTGDTSIALIAVTTTLAAAAGAVAAMLFTWVKFGKSDIGMTLNGALAGLVGITAGCANVSVPSSVVIGLVAGVLVVLSVLFFDKIKVDDPVGAVSVHGVCGAWGTLAAGLFDSAGFSMHTVGVQLIGIATCFVWALGAGLVLFKAIDLVIGMRVTAEEEMTGLDFSEHGASAYPDFQTVHLGSGGMPGGPGGLSGQPVAAAEPVNGKPVTQA
ncbi:ammonium transporter [Desulfuromonas acetoxidans]|uniref:Ammonium transporter n=1 Tax=Desulfuromonas acetoxidans (strain DSM 684 / 11070) TaxID=281689 RepID=Q1K3N8_DESA6|nr:ammonium transporter [Desulfuromonas acetoxidans]EAT16936.1 ammonium transporter [Desulfuromonas acetoxidans DSM 684]MBF0644535.1 ammonium transporter [Desulfuromonas acetoxidans]NVD23938.1 ammonium transporter [Desulfuromonas acetoxidans]NVE16235.1 ammonium transporter [Desulfuromonas acetoxidans]